MDGKTDAEKLVGQLLEDPALLSALAAAPMPQTGETDDSE
jgi:type VI secretion system protein ImpB